MPIDAPPRVRSCHSPSQARRRSASLSALAGSRTPAPPPLLGSGRCRSPEVCESICICREPGEAPQPRGSFAAADPPSSSTTLTASAAAMRSCASTGDFSSPTSLPPICPVSGSRSRCSWHLGESDRYRRRAAQPVAYPVGRPTCHPASRVDIILGVSLRLAPNRIGEAHAIRPL